MGSTKDKKLSASVELRRQAEERLRLKTAESRPPRTEEDAQRLIHELQVHRIELEMQNEELLRTQVALELSRNKYEALYDFAPVGYFTIDAHGLNRGGKFERRPFAGNREGIAAQAALYQFHRGSGGQKDFFETLRRSLSETGQPDL